MSRSYVAGTTATSRIYLLLYIYCSIISRAVKGARIVQKDDFVAYVCKTRIYQLVERYVSRDVRGLLRVVAAATLSPVFVPLRCSTFWKATALLIRPR